MPVPIGIGSIERLQACDDYAIIHTGKQSFTISLTLTELEGRLDPQLFLRVHRSHMVNLEYVVRLTRSGGRFSYAA